MSAQIIQLKDRLVLKNSSTEDLLKMWNDWLSSSDSDDFYINGIWHEDVFWELMDRGVPVRI